MRPDPLGTPETPSRMRRSSRVGAYSPAHFARRALGLGLILASSPLLDPPNVAFGCPYTPPTDEVAIALGAGRAASLRLYVVDPEDADPGLSTPSAAPMTRIETRRCFAMIDMPLSAFPTSRLAMRPADVARSMRDLVEKHGIGTCEIAVFYENDTNEEIAEHELCLQETFAFGERKHWSLAREAFCWEPEPPEFAGIEE